MPTQIRTPATITDEGGENAWTGLGNLQASDDTVASATYPFLEQPNALLLDDFGFTIPTGATIVEITFHIEASGFTANSICTPHIYKGVTLGGGSLGFLPTTEAVIDIGEQFSDPLWGFAWTPAEINNDLNWRVDWDDQFDESGGIAIDTLFVSVEYTGGATPAPTRQIKVRL